MKCLQQIFVVIKNCASPFKSNCVSPDIILCMLVFALKSHIWIASTGERGTRVSEQLLWLALLCLGLLFIFSRYSHCTWVSIKPSESYYNIRKGYLPVFVSLIIIAENVPLARL